MENDIGRETMHLDLTIATPTFNGGFRLPLILESLGNQVETEFIDWEIIVIDNNSQDHTSQIIEEYQKNLFRNFSFRSFTETKQGLAFARQRAIQEADGVWVGFLDDDNVPAENWVSQAVKFSRKKSQMGAFGGQIHAAFEECCPENFQKIKSLFAIREKGEKPIKYQPQGLQLPPGAALVVKREAWLACVPSSLSLVGRVNGSFLAGEDFEALLYLHHADWEIWYCPTMHSFHQIPNSRLEKHYLNSLARGAGFCISNLRLLHVSNWRKPLVLIKIFLGGLRRYLLHLVDHPDQDLHPFIACERVFLWSSACSPFLYCTQAFGKLITSSTIRRKAL
jgi:glycosyltransferase involved in cell wall biosynthesis